MTLDRNGPLDAEPMSDMISADDRRSEDEPYMKMLRAERYSGVACAGRDDIWRGWDVMRSQRKRSMRLLDQSDRRRPRSSATSSLRNARSRSRNPGKQIDAASSWSRTRTATARYAGSRSASSERGPDRSPRHRGRGTRRAPRAAVPRGIPELQSREITGKIRGGALLLGRLVPGTPKPRLLLASGRARELCCSMGCHSRPASAPSAAACASSGDDLFGAVLLRPDAAAGPAGDLRSLRWKLLPVLRYRPKAGTPLSPTPPAASIVSTKSDAAAMAEWREPAAC